MMIMTKLTQMLNYLKEYPKYKGIQSKIPKIDANNCVFLYGYKFKLTMSFRVVF